MILKRDKKCKKKLEGINLRWKKHENMRKKILHPL